MSTSRPSPEAPWDEILEWAIAHTGQERYRITTDPAHPAFVPGMRESIILILKGEVRKTAPPEPIPLPSLARQAANLTRSAARFVASGLRLADEATTFARLEVCRGCDRFDTEQRRCRECGCFCEAKARLGREACPLGKW